MELAACRFNRLTLLFDHHLHTQLRPSVPHSVSLRHIVATCSYLVLQTLDVSQTTLQGPLPPEWGQPQAFPSLRILNASFTQLTGPLPSAWGSASAFQKLENMTFVGSGVSGGMSMHTHLPQGVYLCVHLVHAVSGLHLEPCAESKSTAKRGLQILDRSTVKCFCRSHRTQTNQPPCAVMSLLCSKLRC